MKNSVKVSEIAEKMNLKNLTPDIDLTEIEVEHPDINRLGLQLTGYFDHFDSDRVQIIGYIEYTYVQTLEEERKNEVYEKLMTYKIPVSYTHLIRSDCAGARGAGGDACRRRRGVSG